MNPSLADFQVTDRKSFIEFIDLMLEDFQENPETWEHTSVAQFLVALSDFTEDMQEYYDNKRAKIDADVPSWKTFADILKAATMYKS
jgi:hypothetical protein